MAHNPDPAAGQQAIAPLAERVPSPGTRGSESAGGPVAEAAAWIPAPDDQLVQVVDRGGRDQEADEVHVTASLIAMIIRAFDKHWSWAEHTSDNASRELRLMVGFVMIVVLGVCGLAVAAGIFVSIVMLVSGLTGVDPLPATTVLLSVTGLGGVGLVGLRSWSRFRR
jgi:hypothetical protein